MQTNLPLTKKISSEQQSFSVSELNSIISDILDVGFPAYIWVEGEVSNYSLVSSGHRYFSLKDSSSSISCALFKGSANRVNSETLKNLKNGDKIAVKASISVYKPRGSYQLIVSDIESSGFGKLAKEFADLKLKLEKLGMAKKENKTPIPNWPKQIAVITSATGAAIADVISTLKRRAAFIPVIVYPSLVQGDSASQSIVKAIKKINIDNNSDVILLTRGGGSLEDLQAFNNEELAFAVFKSKIPIVTGVGHETDFSIVDFVSDYRAETPTAAAVCVSPDVKHLQTNLKAQKLSLLNNMYEVHKFKLNKLSYQIQRLNISHPNRQLQQQSQKIDEISQKLNLVIYTLISNQKVYLQNINKRLEISNPAQKLRQKQLQILQYKQKLSLFKNSLENKQNYQKGLLARLKLLSPLGILERGYSLAFDEKNNIISTVKNIKDNQKLKIWLKDGEVSVIVCCKNSG